MGEISDKRNPTIFTRTIASISKKDCLQPAEEQQKNPTSLGIPQRQKMLNKNTHTKWMMEYNEKIKDHTANEFESPEFMTTVELVVKVEIL